MKEWQPIAEEYRAVFEIYKITFDHATTLSKAYAGAVILVLGGITLQAIGERGIEKISDMKLLLSAALAILIYIGALSLVIQTKITKARQRCINRLNFLRDYLLRDVDGFDYDEYMEVCGFPKTVKMGFGRMMIVHSSVPTSLLIFVVLYAVWIFTL